MGGRTLIVRRAEAVRGGLFRVTARQQSGTCLAGRPLASHIASCPHVPTCTAPRLPPPSAHSASCPHIPTCTAPPLAVSYPQGAKGGHDNPNPNATATNLIPLGGLAGGLAGLVNPLAAIIPPSRIVVLTVRAGAVLFTWG